MVLVVGNVANRYATGVYALPYTRYSEGEVARVVTTYLNLLGENGSVRPSITMFGSLRDQDIASHVVPAVREVMQAGVLTEFEEYRGIIMGTASVPREPQHQETAPPDTSTATSGEPRALDQTSTEPVDAGSVDTPTHTLPARELPTSTRVIVSVGLFALMLGIVYKVTKP